MVLQISFSLNVLCALSECVLCVFIRRLAKSTLLLIPLFGVYYVVFFYLMEPENEKVKQVKIFFDLGLGSFQVL